MSYSDDFILDATVSLKDLTAFLTDECDLAAGELDRCGLPIHFCDEFHCRLSTLNDDQRSILIEHLGFTPTWRIECYLATIPHHDCHPRLVEFMQLLMLEYDGDFAWLGNGSTPQIVIRDRQLSIQGNHSPYSHWADYLDQIAKEIGLPYNIIDMPSF